MFFLGKIGVVLNEGDRGIGEQLIRELNIPQGQCEVDDFELEILFESTEIDTLIGRLKAAKHERKFVEWGPEL